MLQKLEIILINNGIGNECVIDTLVIKTVDICADVSLFIISKY